MIPKLSDLRIVEEFTKSASYSLDLCIAEATKIWALGELSEAYYLKALIED